MTNEKKNPNVVTMNSIISEWKQACASGMASLFPDAGLKPENLAKQSWTDIIGVVYKLLTENRMVVEGLTQKDMTYNKQVEYAYAANYLVMAAVGPVDNYRGFSTDKNAYQFYRDNFGAASDYAQRLLDARKYPFTNGYIILPAGTENNNKLPASFQHVTPRAMEMNAVIKNPDAHNVGDVLLYKNDGIVVIKAVPELPREAMEWATQNNIKVYGG